MNKIVLKSNFSLLNADYVQLNKQWNYKNIISPFYRLYFIDDGEGCLSNPDAKVQLEKGYLYLVPSFTLCNYYCPGYLSQYYLHLIEDTVDDISLFALNRKILKAKANAVDISNMKRIMQINPNRGLKISQNPSVYEKNTVLQSFRELNTLSPVSAVMETNGIILQLLSRFLTEKHFSAEASARIPSKILDAVNYIQSNIQQPLTVHELAARANQNPDYFSRLFHAHTGERPLNFIQSKRIERAQFLMVTANLSFSEIAANTGFESAAYFSRMFKKTTGKTPGEYKRKTRQV